MSFLTALSMALVSSASLGAPEPAANWSTIKDTLTIQVTHDHVINPITSGRWNLSGVLETTVSLYYPSTLPL